MRHIRAGLLSVAPLLVVSGIALGASATSGTTDVQYDERYTLTKPGKSTGTRISYAATDTANPRNRQPKRITNFDITFPRGSKIDSKAAPQCKASEIDFAQEDDPDAACPRRSKLGTGTVAVRSPFPGMTDTRGTLSAYNANLGMLWFVEFERSAGTWLLRPKFRGRRLLTQLPQLCIPPTAPANGCRDNSGTPQEFVLTALRVNVERRADGGRRLLRTPATCPSGGWTFEADMKFADGATVDISDKSRCSR